MYEGVFYCIKMDCLTCCSKNRYDASLISFSVYVARLMEINLIIYIIMLRLVASRSGFLINVLVYKIYVTY